MPTGGTTNHERETRAFNERVRASTRAICRVMLAMARPELLPQAPFGKRIQQDAADRIKRMRSRTQREDFADTDAALPQAAVKRD